MRLRVICKGIGRKRVEIEKKGCISAYGEREIGGNDRLRYICMGIWRKKMWET